MLYEVPNGEPVQALRDVGFELEAGRLLTLLGPSGCGKTTLLNILAGFLAPTSGRVTLDGRPITGPGSDRGMVFQQGALFEWLSVERNISFGPRLRRADKGETKARVDELLATVGLQGFGDKQIYELSGGMQQRVALARCLANDPSIILMDEPLGALDALTREKMQDLIVELWNQTGKTIVLVTHSVEEALYLGDQLVRDGSPAGAHSPGLRPSVRRAGLDHRRPRAEGVARLHRDAGGDPVPDLGHGGGDHGPGGVMTSIMNRLRSGQGDARKTVTFGDASAVGNRPLWTVGTIVALVVFWWVATRAWGLSSEFVEANQGLSDKQIIAACDLDEACDGSYYQLANPRKFPSPRDTWNAFFELLDTGFADASLIEHTRASLWRVVRGMFFGIVAGVPIGFAMGLSSRLRSIFDGPVELFRPIPPLALIPLFILIFGIGGLFGGAVVDLCLGVDHDHRGPVRYQDGQPVEGSSRLFVGGVPAPGVGPGAASQCAARAVHRGPGGSRGLVGHPGGGRACRHRHRSWPHDLPGPVTSSGWTWSWSGSSSSPSWVC